MTTQVWLNWNVLRLMTSFQSNEPVNILGLELVQYVSNQQYLSAGDP